MPCRCILRLHVALVVPALLAAGTGSASARTVRMLFIGNSYTYRNDLADVVKRLLEAGDPEVTVDITRVLYGGRTPEHHWEQFRTQDLLRLNELTRAELEAICADLRAKGAAAKAAGGGQAKDAGRYNGAIRHHRQWMKMVGEDAPGWDCVVVQSYRDTRGGLDSSYARYCRKFSELIRARGARMILYNTAPTYQNQDPLDAPPDPAEALAETTAFATLAKELDALLVPVPLAVVRCQTARPGVVLRYHNDGHLNQTCGYLTACCFYAAITGRSPEGLPVDTVIDPKVWDKDNPDAGPDGDPRKVVFPPNLRTFLQTTAWEAVQEAARLAQ